MAKKFLATILALTMVLSLVACGSKAESDTPDDPQTDNTPVNSEHPTWLTDEKVTLSVTTYDSVTDGVEPPSNDQRFWQWLEDYTNVHIEWNIIPYAGYEEVIKTRLASGTDLGDIINVYNIDNGQDAGYNGILMDMAPYWDSCFTKTNAYFEEEGTDYTSLVTNSNGEIYSLVGTVEPIEGHIVICYNTEWMKKLNLEVPKTLDEFTAVLQAMKDAGDLNGDGKDNEIILTSPGISYLYAVLGNAFGLECYSHWDAFQADKNGVVSSEYVSDGYRNMMIYCNELYDAGILDPEIATMSSSAMSEKAAADRVGCFIYYSAFAISYGAMTSAGAQDPTGEYYTIGVPLASKWNNNQGYFIRRDQASSTPTAISAECKNPELACKWLDTLFADPKAIEVRTCGFEGEHFNYAADGSVELIMPADGSDWDIQSMIGGGQITLAFIQTKQQLLVSKLQYPWYLEEYANIRDNYEWRSPSVARVNYFSEEEQETIDTYKPDFFTYIKEMRTGFPTGKFDASDDAVWNEYCSTLEKLGLKELTSAYQSVYDRTTD